MKMITDMQCLRDRIFNKNSYQKIPKLYKHKNKDERNDMQNKSFFFERRNFGRCTKRSLSKLTT